MKSLLSMNEHHSFVKNHQPCPCGKSSDAFSARADGSGMCFSCGKPHIPGDRATNAPATVLEAPRGILEGTKEFINHRGVGRAVMEKYGVYVLNERLMVFPYAGGAAKIRTLDKEKEFFAHGAISHAGLFGKQLFPPACYKRITITEGELDAMSAYEIFGMQWPVVSVQNAGAARRNCEQDRDYLNSFEEIVLAFDADEPGKLAAHEVCKLFGYKKVRIVALSPELKDANGYLQADQGDEFKRAWRTAHTYTPSGIVGSWEEIDTIIDNRTSHVGDLLPMPTLNEMVGGLRPGEIYLFTAKPGVGKSEICHWIESVLLKNTEHNIGIIHIEEKKEETIARLAGYQMGIRAHKPGDAKPEEIKAAYRDLTKRSERLWIYTQFGSDNPDVILDKIRFGVTVQGWKVVVLDHISKVVSGLSREEDRRIAIEYLSDALDQMAVELNFCLILVSHVNKEGDTFNSGAPARVASAWVHLDRDVLAENEFTRRVTYLSVLKNRNGSVTGPAGKLLFDPEKNLLSELVKEDKLPT